jgi:hypothetical protein
MKAWHWKGWQRAFCMTRSMALMPLAVSRCPGSSELQTSFERTVAARQRASSPPDRLRWAPAQSGCPSKCFMACISQASPCITSQSLQAGGDAAPPPPCHLECIPPHSAGCHCSTMGNMSSSYHMSHEVFIQHAGHVLGVSVITPAAWNRTHVVHINPLALHE